MQIQSKGNNQYPITSVQFNQDASCFITTTRRGFSVFSTKPVKHLYSTEFATNFNIASLLFKSSITALASDNLLSLYDDQSQRFLGEHSFESKILQINLTRSTIIIVEHLKTSILNLNDMAILQTYETAPNPMGAISSTQHFAILGNIPSSVKVFFENDYSKFLSNLHKSPIQHIQLSSDGKYLATASEKGTIIRIWSVHSQRKYCELRRGHTQACINSIAFGENDIIAVTSSSKTLHVFKIQESENEIKSFFKQDIGCSQAICKFDEDQIVVVGADMKVWRIDSQMNVSFVDVE
ncbi:WD40 repeat protein [Spironucleus salmonicida]|uniref:WD40 repeat protein n=1 Tax=Spironucleus salmonicida TaxID=348837 RepID=V6LLD4_9EUKA|nr:WD40 repeat protein [Spironucleus salmonicida]|eukprot:EST45455.1 WD40 repeat-containing protein [Spironucleus salmonicida]